jgi:protein-tyrosine phosphatase
MIDGVEAASAGTAAEDAQRMAEQSAAIALRFGASAEDVTRHRARRLEPPMIHEADLVLALTRDHRQQILALVPGATRRTFTVREFAHVSASMPAVDAVAPGVEERLRSRVASAAAFRGVVPSLRRVEDADVIDPYRRSDAVYEASAAQLVPAVDAVSRFILKAAGGPA